MGVEFLQLRFGVYSLQIAMPLLLLLLLLAIASYRYSGTGHVILCRKETFRSGRFVGSRQDSCVHTIEG